MLYGRSQLTLGFGANAGALSSHHSAMRIEEFFQNFDIFVVDEFDIILSEEALFHGFV